MKIDHVGYAVRDIEKAKQSFIDLGFVFQETIVDKDRSISISFGEMDGYRIELVSPIKGIVSPVDMILSKLGPAPYHFCYTTDNIEAAIKKLKASKFKVSVPLAPAIAFGNKRVVFLYSLSVGLIELVES